MKSTELIEPLAMAEPIANKGIKNNIPEDATGTNNASVAEGFPEITMISPLDGGKPPLGQDCNGMFYMSTDQKVFLQNGGILTFNQSVSDTIGGYPKGAMLDYLAADGTYSKVQSLIDDNTFNFILTPTYIDNEHWRVVSISTDLSNTLTQAQITNTILLSNNPQITSQNYTNIDYVNHGCTVENNIASDFGEDNYILLNKIFTNSNTFDFEIPFNLSDTNGIQSIAAINNYDNCISIENAKINLRYNGLQLNGQTTLQTNTDYTVKLTRTNSEYILQLKTGSADYTTEITLSSSEGYFSGKSIYIGSDKNGNYLHGLVNLNNVKITADGNYYWVILPEGTPNELMSAPADALTFSDATVTLKAPTTARYFDVGSIPVSYTTTTNLSVAFTSSGAYTRALLFINQPNKALALWGDSGNISYDENIEPTLTSNYGLWWKGSEKLWYQKTPTVTTWTAIPYSLIGEVTKLPNANTITSVTLYPPIVEEFQTVTLSGTLNTLMPDGRNIDNTLKNQKNTIILNDTLLYQPVNNTKTILVQDSGEIMIRDYYVEAAVQPEAPLNGVWFDTDNNQMKVQLSTYPNLINNGATITDGIVSNFADNNYIQLPETYTLGDNWDINLAFTPIQSNKEEVILGNVSDSVESSEKIPEGLSLIYNGTDTVTLKLRRNDVFVVQKEVITSVAYEVTKTISGVTTTGYVKTSGNEGSYVAEGEQVYSDSNFNTPLETAATSTWTYTGNTENNTEILRGYSKTVGGALVPSGTVIYSDANCTTIQGTASGTDYVYTGLTEVSIIGEITTAVVLGEENTFLLSYDGANYKLNTSTLANTDNIQEKINIPLGNSPALISSGTSLPFSGTINLNTSTFSFWTWNKISNTVTDFVNFIGAKIGSTSDNGTVITSMNIDTPVELAKITQVERLETQVDQIVSSPITNICTTKPTTKSTATNEIPAVVVQNYRSGNNYIRIWSDKWCEQGGFAAASGNNYINLLKAYPDTNYTVDFVQQRNRAASSYYSGYVTSLSTTQILLYSTLNGDSRGGGWWHAKGYLA